MTARLEICTPHGDRYLIHENGRIQRIDMAFTPSDSWRMLGLVLVRSNSIAVKTDAITAEWLAAHPLQYKNRKPRYTIADLDHGTLRHWGNTTAHGVASIRVLPTPENAA